MTDAPNGVPTPPQYNAPTPPAYNPAPAPAAQPGRTMGIVALILAFFMPPIGLILGFVAMSQSKKAGQKNGLALAAIIIGAIATVIWIISIIVSITMFGVAAGEINQQLIEAMCTAENSGEVVTVEGYSVTCP